MSRTGTAARSRPDTCPRTQSAIAMGIVFESRVDRAQLETVADAGGCCRLRHAPRTRASRTSESFGAILAPRRDAVPGVARRRTLVAHTRPRPALGPAAAADARARKTIDAVPAIGIVSTFLSVRRARFAHICRSAVTVRAPHAKTREKARVGSLLLCRAVQNRDVFSCPVRDSSSPTVCY